MTRVSVIVPARNAAATLPALLGALDRQDVGEAFEVIVVDDGSSDGTAALAEEHPIGAVMLRTGIEGDGPSAARNLGAQAASGDVLAFTDADCEPEPGWLRAGLSAIDGGADVVQGRVEPPAGTVVGPFDRSLSVKQFSHLYETANLFVRRQRFEAVGAFEAWLLPERSKELGEDVWLGWRLRRAGARVAFADDAVVRHAVFPRGPGRYVAEHLRRRYFPALAARVPELRDTFLYRRWFLTRRSAEFSLALAGTATALALRRPALLAAAAPYARTAARDALAWSPPPSLAAKVAVTEIAADAVGFAATAAGSIRARSLVL